ncbi:hypothetical protein [Bacillus mobilis]|uniref:hypothetical protein n=1 Tax=Bacillus mobilis TaxID=2026190 RepID=UPI00366CA815
MNRSERERYMKEKECRGTTNRITTDLEPLCERNAAGPPQHKSGAPPQAHYAWCITHIRTEIANFDGW